MSRPLSLPQLRQHVATPRTVPAPAPNRLADSDRAETEIAPRAHALHVACPCLSMPQKRLLRNEIFQTAVPVWASVLFASNIRFTDSRSKTTSVNTANT